MKIALSSYSCWPYGRKGERYLHDLAKYLIHKGHTVDIIASKPGKDNVRIVNDVRILYHGQKHFSLFSWKYPFYRYSLSCFKTFLENKYDVIQSLFFVDGFGATLSRKFYNKNQFYYLIPSCDFFWDGWIAKKMFERSIYSATRIISPSHYLNSLLKNAYNLNGEVISPGVDTSYFLPAQKKKIDPPRILCMSALAHPEKRIPLLLRAFELLKKYIPEAVLQLAGPGDRITMKHLRNMVKPETVSSVFFLGAGKEEDVPSLYADATISVLPAVNQSFGMPLIESLSCGTPVVAARSGAVPEIVNDPNIGVLFEKDNVEALCKAMLKGIQLASDSETSGRCRLHALPYDWNTVIGPKLEMLYVNNLQ